MFIMNTYQTKIFNDLNLLVAENEAFSFNDWELDGIIYRNFSYRLASYTDFCNDSALECRGIMFEIDENEQPVRLASFPFEKFFNLRENPFVMDLDLSTIDEITVKADGSLITTYLHNDVLRVKTKGSLHSDQAVAAKLWLYREENIVFREELMRGEILGYTTIMEWVSSENRIVLPYLKPELKVLGVRNRVDGSYISYYDIDAEHFPEILKRWTEIIHIDGSFITNKEFVESIPDMQKIEGYVIQFEDGQRVKIKTTWYLALHHTKDSINTPRRLYEAVLEEATDDMRSLFYDDPLAIKLISEMEIFVEVKYNHLINTVECFYKENKDLDRKSYAILGQKELNKLQFGLVMQKYIGRDLSYKDVMKKRWKEFGFKDEKVIE